MLAIEQSRKVQQFPGATLTKYHKLGGLKTNNRENYCITVLEARSPNSRCEQNHSPLKLQRDPFLASPQLLLGTPLNPRGILPFLCVYAHNSLFTVCKNNSYIGLRITLMSLALFDYIWKDYFQVRTHHRSWRPGLLQPLLGVTSQPITPDECWQMYTPVQTPIRSRWRAFQHSANV